MLSNSDCKGKNEEDNFFDNLYRSYQIECLVASRSINSNPYKRGKLTEILVYNYLNTKAKAFRENFMVILGNVRAEDVLAHIV